MTDCVKTSLREMWIRFRAMKHVAATRLPGKRVLHTFFSQWRSACGAQRQSPVALQLRTKGNLPGSSQFKRSFRAWKLYARFMVAHKTFRQQGRTRRKEILLEKLRKAENAANSHLPGELYKAIRDIAPKRKREKVQIRSVEGKFLNVNEEMTEIQLHCQHVFGTGSFCMDTSTMDPLGIEASEISVARMKSQTGKAVPTDSAPVAAWKACSAMLSDRLSQLANSHWRQGALWYPHTWADSHLALIPKPGKMTKRPKDLRPLGVQGPGGKCMARILKERLLAEIGQTLQDVPQYAYIPGKPIGQAIARVASHCSRIRSRLREGMETVHTRRQKMPKGQSRGGAQLSIDLSRAFDLLPRDVMQKALLHCGASSNLTDLILFLRCKSGYRISCGKQTACVEMKRGVRQGCTLAPVLFSAFTAHYLHLLEARASKQWVSSNATLFADDSHLAWERESVNDLNQMQKMVQISFALFAELGMQVNPEKSTLIFGLRGRSLRKWVKKRLFHRQKTRLVNWGTPTEPLQIPVQDKMVYLGVVMSYQQFELQTLQRRMKVATVQKRRLVKVLHSARAISLKHRIRVCLACVRSMTMYGLHAVGVGQKAAVRLCSFENRRLRALARSPVHITRESTSQLFARLGITPTLEYLTRFLSRRIPKVDPQTAQWFTQKLAELQACSVPASANTEPADHSTLLPVRTDCKQESCPTCGLYFADLSSMRKRRAKKHGVSLVNPAVKSSADRAALDLAPRMVDGMPKCPHCLKVFPRPQGLREHIIADCPVLHGSKASAGDSAWASVPGVPNRACDPQKLGATSACRKLMARSPETA